MCYALGDKSINELVQLHANRRVVHRPRAALAATYFGGVRVTDFAL